MGEPNGFTFYFCFSHTLILMKKCNGEIVHLCKQWTNSIARTFKHWRIRQLRVRSRPLSGASIKSQSGIIAFYLLAQPRGATTVICICRAVGPCVCTCLGCGDERVHARQVRIVFTGQGIAEFQKSFKLTLKGY